MQKLILYQSVDGKQKQSCIKKITYLVKTGKDDHQKNFNLKSWKDKKKHNKNG